MNDNFEVSIITVCYNSEKTIVNTIESVLNQSYNNYEYIIIDGKSKDNTNNIIQTYKNKFKEKGIKLIHVIEKDNGIYDAMNKGIRHSNGKWINFMNSDDKFHDSKVLERIFKENNIDEYDILYGNERRIGKKISINKPTIDIENIKKNKFFCHQSSFTKKEIIKNNEFDLQFKICSDYDNFLNLYLQGKNFKYVDVLVADYSIEGTSNRNYYKTIKENYEVRKKYNLDNFSDFQIKLRAVIHLARHVVKNIK